jgi:CBS-domain-containing membrane protein
VNRRDAYLDAMLRHLGASYYQTLRGEATAAEVAQAVEAVAEFQARADRGAEAGHAGTGGAPEMGSGRRRRGRWRVHDVMTINVATADRNLPYKQAAKLMSDQQVTAIPVVTESGRVVGMVSEADLLRKVERRPQRGTGLSGQARRDRAKAGGRTAGELMTSPAITIYPDASLSAAARLMNAHHIRRLPVVNTAGELIGIVSRRDLMKVFLRPDEEIAAEVNDVLGQILLAEAGPVVVSVLDGVVTLDGALDDEDLIRVVVGLAAEVAGVVTVVSRLTHAKTRR